MRLRVNILLQRLRPWLARLLVVVLTAQGLGFNAHEHASALESPDLMQVVMEHSHHHHHDSPDQAHYSSSTDLEHKHAADCCGEQCQCSTAHCSVVFISASTALVFFDGSSVAQSLARFHYHSVIAASLYRPPIAQLS